MSLSTYGKWPAVDWPVDGFSGEFPAFYNFLSDYLLSWWANAVYLPEFHVQALLYGPVLAATMLFLNFVFLALVLGSRAKALAASLMISFGTDLAIPDQFYSYFGEQDVWHMKNRMHVPFVAMPLGTGQSLGWLLFVPVLACVHQLTKRDNIIWAAASGAGLGLLFQTHTLTFLNVTTAACLFIYLHSLSRDALKARSFTIRCLFVTVVVLVLIWWGSSTGVGFSIRCFAVLWLALIVASIQKRRDVLLLGVMGLAAVATSLHYLIHLFELRQWLNWAAEMKAGGMVRGSSVFLYFLPLWLSATGALVMLRWKGNSSLLWAVSILLATWALSLGGYWGFENHPYRMTIHLIFPLSMLFAMFSFGDEVPIAVRASWLGLMIALFIPSIARNIDTLQGKDVDVAKRGYVPRYYALAAPTSEETQFFGSIQRNLVGPGKILLPPEHAYPIGMTWTSMMLGYSAMPSFIPDSRYVGWQDLFAQRVKFYCNLFPTFPNAICQGSSDRSIDGAGLLTPNDETTRADILPLYGIRFVGHWLADDASQLSSLAAGYGLKAIRVLRGKGLFALSQRSDRIGFGRASYRKGELHIDLAVPTEDCYTIIMGGPQLRNEMRGVFVNGKRYPVARLGQNAAYLGVWLAAGTQHMSLEVAPDNRFEIVLPTPLYYITGVPSKDVGRYLQSRFPIADKCDRS